MIIFIFSEALKQKLSQKNQSNDDDEVKKKKNHDVTNPEKPKKSKIRENFESNDPMAEELAGTSSFKKAKYTSSDEEIDMAYHHPSEVAKKLAAKKAVDELKNRRKEKKEGCKFVGFCNLATEKLLLTFLSLA